MRPITLTPLLLLVFHFTPTAQKLSVLPQVGLENSRTSIQYNNLPSFSPLGATVSPYLGVRMNYEFKEGHGPFVGVATSRSAVNYGFADPQTGMSAYKASAANMRLQFQGGYQVSTGRIYFHTPGSKAKPDKLQAGERSVRKSCGSYTRRSCGKKSSEKTASASAVDKGWFVRIQPSAGVAFMSAMEPAISVPAQGTNASYQYKGGNWNTALLTGAAFEFGSNQQSRFTVSINHLKGIGNLKTTRVQTSTEGKAITTSLKSDVSSWAITAGIPISLQKKKHSVKKVEAPTYKTFEKKENYKKSPCQYLRRCPRFS